MTSQKISEFVVVNSFENTDYVNIIRNNTNFAVPFSAYAPALGAIGTINVVGGTGSPVLDQPDAVTNDIRNLEDGYAIRTSISAQNGIRLDHNFTQDAVGVPLVDNLSTLSPTFPSVLAGAGMQINRLGDVLTFTATGDPLPATAVVAINSITDFPADVLGAITLEDDTVYVISNQIVTALEFVMGVRTTIIGWSPLGPLFEYTGTGTMFTGVDADSVFINLRLSATNGKVFDFTRTTGFNGVIIDNVAIQACDSVGTFNAELAVGIRNLIVIFAASNGINFTGSGQSISIIDFAILSFSATFVAIDFGVSVTDNIVIVDLIANAPAGAIGIKGAANDANIASTGFASVSNSAFIGDITPLSGISVPNDVQWQFSNNQGIEDTMADALLSMQSNAVSTVIVTQSVGVLLAGTWTIEQEAQATSTTAGRVTYNGKKTVRVPVTLSVTIAPVSGGTQTMGVMIALNGVAIPNSLKTASAASGSVASITLPWQLTLVEGDYVEAFATNESGTTNVLASTAILRLN